MEAAPSPHPPGAVSAIPSERVTPGPAPLAFRLAVAGLAVAATGFLAGLAFLAGPPRTTEAAALAADGAWGALLSTFGVPAIRLLSAAASGAALAAVAFAGRRLLHSETAGGLAALFVAMDPAFLQWGHLALPHATMACLLAGALAFLLSPTPTLPWTGALLLSLAALVEPWTVLWALPLALLVLVRGHIYATGRHLATSLTQCVLLPGLAALGGLLGGTAPACLRGPWHEELLLARILESHPGHPAAHNPALWFAGLAAALILAATAVLRAARSFRLARLPGRLQIRLPEPLPPLEARTLWLLGLVLLAPHPALLWPLLAISLAAGLVSLGQDAPGFGAALAATALLFGVAYLAQAWPAVAGAEGGSLDGLLRMAPWGRVAGCS